jgi:transcriptional regulator with XRE-family HTH domain
MSKGLGEALRLIRVIYDTPQSVVARKAGVPQQLLSAYEQNRRRVRPDRALRILQAIADEVPA